MGTLDPNQLEILQGVRAGRYLGPAPLAQLRSDIDLMLALRIPIAPVSQQCKARHIDSHGQQEAAKLLIHLAACDSRELTDFLKWCPGADSNRHAREGAGF